MSFISRITYVHISAVAAVLFLAWLFLWIDSPVTEKTRLPGTVTGFISGRGTLYHVKLDNGQTIIIRPPVIGRPGIGDRVIVTRREYANGREIYKFTDMFD